MKNTSPIKNKVLVSSYGSGIAIGLQGATDFITHMENLFFNYGGVSDRADLHWETDTFAYFLSTREKAIDALALKNQVTMIMRGESKAFKKNPKGFEDYCLTNAQDEFASYENESFMNQRLGEDYTLSPFSSESGTRQRPEEDFHFDQVVSKAIAQG